MRCIIAGGRDFDNYEFLKERRNRIFSNELPDIIFSGRCYDPKNGKLTFVTEDGIKVYGADGLGERYAKENYIKVYPYPADFKQYGKAGGPIRNRYMAERATHCIIFWDGKSKGSFDMQKAVKEFDLPTRIIYY